MPIYEYRCSDCLDTNDFFMKMDAPPPTICPSCNQSVLMTKKVTAAAFQLKGTGWYATDFKDQQPNKTSESNDNQVSKPVDKKADETSTKASKPKQETGHASKASSSTSTTSTTESN